MGGVVRNTSFQLLPLSRGRPGWGVFAIGIAPIPAFPRCAEEGVEVGDCRMTRPIPTFPRCRGKEPIGDK